MNPDCKLRIANCKLQIGRQWSFFNLQFSICNFQVAIFCALCVYGLGTPAEAQSAQTLRWAGDAEGGAPFVLRDPKDPSRVTGFEVELAEALAERLGMRAEFVQYEWVNLVPGLQKGDFDVILNGFEVTPERRQHVLFCRPYYVFTQQLVVRAAEERIHKIEDCRPQSDRAGGLTVGTLSGSAAARLLRSLGDIPINEYDGQVEPYLDLEFGRVDAVLLDWPIALYYAQTNPKLKFVASPPDKFFYALAVRNDNAALAAALNRALGELMASGRLREIYRKWHIWTDGQIELAGVAAQKPGFSEKPGFSSAERRAAERQGLRPESPNEPPPADAVDIHIIAASARLWTIDQYGWELVKGAGMTVFLSVAGMAVAMIIGLLVCLCRLYGIAPLRFLALIYVEFFRGIPLLFLLFVLYFGLAAYGVHMPATATAILGFGLNYAAYEAEIYRSAILSVPAGQWEAARALGMSDALGFRRIIFPQAFRNALAPMTNDFVALFKDTSLVSVIAVRELTKEYLILSRSSLEFFKLGMITAALYLLMSVPLGYLSRYLEGRWGAAKWQTFK